jgi:hypothetical protein
MQSTIHLPLGEAEVEVEAMNGPDMAAVAAAVGPGLGAALADGTAIVRPLPVPGLGDDRVWLVRDDLSDHPMQCYVGAWPDGTVRVLSDDQPAFFDLVASTGTGIHDADTAIGYVRAFLEATRGPMVIVREVTDLGDLRWRPGSDAEEERRRAFEADPPIEPPVADATPGGFRVELTLVVDTRVQRNVFDVARDGSLAAGFKVVARDLPLPTAR